MNDNEIKKGRKKYNKLHKEKEYYLNKKQELEELKKDPKVQQYLETVKFLDRHTDKEYQEDVMRHNAFKNLAKRTKNSNNIFIFMGFRNKRSNMAIDPKLIDYAAFMNIETMELEIVNYSNYKQFCSDNKIIFISDGYTYNPSDYYMEEFLKLRKKYLSSLIELDQEEAIEGILKR